MVQRKTKKREANQIGDKSRVKKAELGSHAYNQVQKPF
jgi:hypothetical protein